MNNSVCEIPLPEPISKKSRDLSTISGIKAPRTKEMRLKLKSLLILGISNINNGMAT